MYPPLQPPSCATHIHDRPRISDANSFHPLLYTWICILRHALHAHPAAAMRTAWLTGHGSDWVSLHPLCTSWLHVRDTHFTFVSGCAQCSSVSSFSHFPSPTHPFQSLESYHLWYYMFYYYLLLFYYTLVSSCGRLRRFWDSQFKHYG